MCVEYETIKEAAVKQQVMSGYRNKVLLVVVVLAVAWMLTMTGCATGAGEPKEGEILLRVNVLIDQPGTSDYELMTGTPKNVGVYEFYHKEPGIPGSGTFSELGSVSLDKLNDTEFHGTSLDMSFVDIDHLGVILICVLDKVGNEVLAQFLGHKIELEAHCVLDETVVLLDKIPFL